MLPFEDPCEGCLVNVLCEQMCPKVIKFYSNFVRKRSKIEVEAATGYYWEDDYVDQNGIIHAGCAQHKLNPIDRKEEYQKKQEE